MQMRSPPTLCVVILYGLANMSFTFHLTLLNDTSVMELCVCPAHGTVKGDVITQLLAMMKSDKECDDTTKEFRVEKRTLQLEPIGFAVYLIRETYDSFNFEKLD